MLIDDDDDVLEGKKKECKKCKHKIIVLYDVENI